MNKLWKEKRLWKGAALTGTLALCLTLSSCYIPADEISSNTENMTIGSNNLPFSTVAPSTATPTRAPTATPDPNQQANPQPTFNWDNDNWGPSATNPLGVSITGGLNPSTTIAVATLRPTATLPPATATPASSSLKKGATGSEVRSVQQRLKELGYLSGSVDGDFGSGTENAVRAFQAANGLTVDGVVGKRTLDKLNSNNAVTAAKAKTTPKPKATNKPKATAKPTPKRTAKPTAKPTATPNLAKAKYLTIGSSGKDVTTLQKRLISLGWMEGEADGEYGGATQAAVKAFQKREGLWDDGIAGPDTQAKLYSSGASKTSTPVASTGESLKAGMNGDAVRALQKRLKALGFYNGSVDGDYGSGTTAAVEAFQAANGLKVDGIAGTNTLNKVYEEEAKSSSSGSTTSSSTFSSTGYVTLREGDKNDSVRKLQEQLKKLGYYSGSVDGSYGSGTVAAVLSFQKQNNLKEDGVAGPATQRVLYGTNSSITYATIRPGDEGTAVTNLQYTLYELGYYDGRVAGVYGDTTSDAVRAFQIRNDVSPVDGIAGNKTLQKMYSSSAVAAAASNTEYKTLREGDIGNEVVELQDCLKQLGYLAEITGIYDNATTVAVRAFQQNNGLTVDGVAGADTQAKLYSNSAR